MHTHVFPRGDATINMHDVAQCGGCDCGNKQHHKKASEASIERLRWICSQRLQNLFLCLTLS